MGMGSKIEVTMRIILQLHLNLFDCLVETFDECGLVFSMSRSKVLIQQALP
jgi:hypothetical protein